MILLLGPCCASLVWRHEKKVSKKYSDFLLPLLVKIPSDAHQPVSLYFGFYIHSSYAMLRIRIRDPEWAKNQDPGSG